MSLADTIKSKSLDPRRFVGRPGRKCGKCNGVFHYVNRCGGVQCERCSPPADGDMLVRIAFSGGVWVEPGEDGFSVEEPATQQQATSRGGRGGSGGRLSDIERRLRAPLGPLDYEHALAWAERVSDWSNGSVGIMKLDDINDALDSLIGIDAAPRVKLDVPAYVPVERELLEGRTVRLVRPVPCFGGAWPAGAMFNVTGWAGGPRWNLQSSEHGNAHRGICACRREDFELIDTDAIVVDLGDLLSGL